MPSDLDAPFIPADLRPAPSVIMASMISARQRRAITGHLFDRLPKSTRRPKSKPTASKDTPQ